jgi:hypothetical protein
VSSYAAEIAGAETRSLMIMPHHEPIEQLFL